MDDVQRREGCSLARGARMRFQTRCNFHLGHIAALPHASRTCLAVRAIRWQITIPAHSAACSSMLGGCGAKPSPSFKPLHLLPLNVCCAVVQPLLSQKRCVQLPTREACGICSAGLRETGRGEKLTVAVHLTEGRLDAVGDHPCRSSSRTGTCTVPQV